MHDLADRSGRARRRIEPRRLQRHADGDAVFRRSERRKGGQRGGKGDRNTETATHARFPLSLAAETNSLQLCTAGGATVKLTPPASRIRISLALGGTSTRRVIPGPAAGPAGIQGRRSGGRVWIPAYAGMTLDVP